MRVAKDVPNVKAARSRWRGSVDGKDIVFTPLHCFVAVEAVGPLGFPGFPPGVFKAF